MIFLFFSVMRKTGILLLIILAAVIICISVIFVLFASEYSYNPITVKDILDSQFADHSVKITSQRDYDDFFDIYFTENDILRAKLNMAYPLDGVSLTLHPINSLSKEFRELRPDPNEKSVIVYPLFTAAAYSEPGFYTFFREECDKECITVNFANAKMGYTSSGMATQILYQLGYDFITDADVDLHPEILEQYDKVILLHNEYVTKKAFDALSAHPKLIFLYPNALYAEVSANYLDNTITLISGHQYPNYPNGPANGFGYKVEEDFHKYEYDAECIKWEFMPINNGYHLNCYPDSILLNNLEILAMLKDL